MNKLPFMIRSRTFWLVVLTVLVNVIPQLRQLLPDPWRDLVTVGLGTLATLAHLNPSQTYSHPADIAAQPNPLVKCPLDPPKIAPKTPSV